MKKRVVITGMGAISPLGNSIEEFWTNIKDGVCGIGEITRFDTTDFPCKVAAELKSFDPADYMDKKEARRMDKFTQYAIAAAKQAIESSGIDFTTIEPTRAGVIIGSGIGGMETFEEQARNLMEKGPGRVSPFFIPMQIVNIASGHIAIMWGIRGVNYSVVSACASGTNAIGEAMRAIRHGYADVMVAGGTEATITPISTAGFSNMKALSTNPDPKSACRPFDVNRDGFVMGEGSGIVILEELEHAKARGANIIAELVGYGATDDAYHITAPSPDSAGATSSMKMAVTDAGIAFNEVDYINAHGTSTPYNDKLETQAIKNAFGEHAYDLVVSSTKSMTGHMLGAAGGIEAIVCALALRDGFIPATIGTTEQDPELDLDFCLGKGRTADLKVTLSNSFGFGGHNATIVLKKYQG